MTIEDLIEQYQYMISVCIRLEKQQAELNNVYAELDWKIKILNDKINELSTGKKK